MGGFQRLKSSDSVTDAEFLISGSKDQNVFVHGSVFISINPMNFFNYLFYIKNGKKRWVRANGDTILLLFLRIFLTPNIVKSLPVVTKDRVAFNLANFCHCKLQYRLETLTNFPVKCSYVFTKIICCFAIHFL